ncbi:MAG: hypothetical protein PHY02_00965 [Phycisphaerae bacterium]|nr:hypothetical protein [Phycisphaerae bacterium]
MAWDQWQYEGDRKTLEQFVRTMFVRPEMKELLKQYYFTEDLSVLRQLDLLTGGDGTPTSNLQIILSHNRRLFVDAVLNVQDYPDTLRQELTQKYPEVMQQLTTRHSGVASKPPVLLFVILGTAIGATLAHFLVHFISSPWNAVAGGVFGAVLLGIGWSRAWSRKIT